MKKHDRVYWARALLAVGIDLALWVTLIFSELSALTALQEAPGFWAQPLAGWLTTLLFAALLLTLWGGLKLRVGAAAARDLFHMLRLGEGWPS